MTQGECEQCAKSEVQLWCLFDDSCMGCRARMLSRGPFHFEARRRDRQTRDYRRALEINGITHEQVKAALAKDYMGRGRR